MKSIFERELAGELISTDNPEYDEILTIIKETMNSYQKECMDCYSCNNFQE